MRPGKSRDPVNWGTVNRGFTVVWINSDYDSESKILTCQATKGRGTEYDRLP